MQATGTRCGSRTVSRARNPPRPVDFHHGADRKLYLVREEDAGRSAVVRVRWEATVQALCDQLMCDGDASLAGGCLRLGFLIDDTFLIVAFPLPVSSPATHARA